MAELPFLVVHGWWIAKLLVMACGALGLVVIRALRRRAERKDIANELLARTGSLCGLTEGPVSVRGRLRGRVVTRFGLDGTQTHERSDLITIEVEGRPVEVRGAIDVVRGSQARASWRRGRTFTVSDGDEVIAKGTLAHVASEGGDYRESAGEWVFEGSTEVFAAKAAVRPPALHPMRLATYAALVAGIGYCVLWGLGAGLISGSKVEYGGPKLEHLAPFGGLAIASALPHTRPAALEELDQQLSSDFVRTTQTDDLNIELAGLRYGCHGRATAQIYALRFEAAAATAKGCGLRKVQAEALGYLGRYDESSALDTKAVTAIAAGKWADAASAANELLDYIKQHPGSDAEVSARFERRTQCLVLWFSAKAKAATAEPQLAELAHGNTACAIAYALTMPVDQRAGLLTTAAAQNSEDELGQSILAAALAWSYGAKSDPDQFAVDSFSAIEALTGRMGFDRYLWLGKIALAVRPDDPIALGRDATLAALEGDQPRAQREIVAARATSTEDLEPLAQAIALHTPDVIAAQRDGYLHPAIAPLVALRAGQVRGELDVVSNCESELRDALVRASHGDGGPLVHLLGTCTMLFDANAGFLLAVAPHVTSHRAELASVVRAFHESYGPSDYGAPFSYIIDAATRRDLARFTGDDAAADSWQRIVTAQARLLTDRDKVEALLLWNEL